MLIILLHTNLIMAQETVKSILDKTVALYQAEKYGSYYTTHTVYSGYESSYVAERYKGIIVKKDGIDYMRVHDTEFISFSDFNLKINHDQKAAMIQPNTQDKKSNTFDIMKQLEGFEGQLQTTDKYYICEFKPKQVVTTQLLSKVIIKINKKDYTMVSQTMYHSQKVRMLDEKGVEIYVEPKIVISYQHRKKDEKKDSQLLKKENYFKVVNNEIVLSERLKDYTFYY